MDLSSVWGLLGKAGRLTGIGDFMRWQFWSVAGQALNFGARRMETIMRVAWLPVVLLLLVNMVTVFVTLSLAIDRPITFEQTGSFAAAQAAYPQFLAIAVLSKPKIILALTIFTVLISLLLVASFMAPLIRYAATGEKPAPGFLSVPFGPDQWRFTGASLATGIFPVMLVLVPFFLFMRHLFTSLKEALGSQDFVSFPTDQSIHTIRITNEVDVLFGTSRLWLFGVPVPVWLLGIPFLLILLVLLHRHFQPKNRRYGLARPEQEEINPFIRFGVITALLTLVVSLLWGAMTGFIPLHPWISWLIPQIPDLLDRTGFIVFSILLLYFYVSLRIFPWPGYTVMDRSMRTFDVLAATRGWNLFRIIGLIVLLSLVLLFVSIVINMLLVFVFLPTLTSILGLLVPATRMVNSGFTADWVIPTAQWTWTLTRLLLNIFWMFFSYGVLAGLFGRLYAQAKAGEPYMPSA